jgi:hypothetical protein
MNIKNKFAFIGSSFNAFLLLLLGLCVFINATLISTAAHSAQLQCEEILYPDLYKDYDTEIFPFPLAIAYTNRSHRISFIPKSPLEAHVYPVKSVNDDRKSNSNSNSYNELNSQTITLKELLALKQFLNSKDFIKEWNIAFKKIFVHFKVNGRSLKRIMSAVENHQLELNNINYRALVKNSIIHLSELSEEDKNRKTKLNRNIYISFENEFGTLTTQKNHPVHVFQIEKDNPVLKNLQQKYPTEYAHESSNKIALVIDEDHSFYQIILHTGFESSMNFNTEELIQFISNVIIPILIEDVNKEISLRPNY